VRVDITVPPGLVQWVARQLGVTESHATRLVREAVRRQAYLVTKSVEVLDGELIVTSNFTAPPREGRWFECGRGVGRRMVAGKTMDDEGDSQ
jgi:hypothetical protein